MSLSEKTSILGQVVQTVKYEAASVLVNDSFRQSLGLSRDDFRAFVFNQEVCNLTRDLRWFYSQTYGNCFQFNSGDLPLKMTTFQGDQYGLWILVGPLVNANKKYPATIMQGLRVYVHNQSYAPSYFDSSLLVERGKLTNIGIRRVFSHSQPKPYSNCDDLSRLG